MLSFTAHRDTSNGSGVSWHRCPAGGLQPQPRERTGHRLEPGARANTLSGYIPPHRHPSDRGAPQDAVDPSVEGASGVVFTFSDGGVPDAGSPMVAPVDGRRTLDRPDAPHLVNPTPESAPASAPVDVPKPRPRA